MKRTRIRKKGAAENKSDPSTKTPRIGADSDKSGTDKNADHTIKQTGVQKFNKPRREEDPDKTGTDIQTDPNT